jgi:hypothetical protein
MQNSRFQIYSMQATLIVLVITIMLQEQKKVVVDILFRKQKWVA